MDEFKNLWEEVLTEVVIPRGYLDTRVELMQDSDLISKAFQYCIIMRTKEGIEEFLNYNGSYSKFFKNKLTDVLNLENESEETRNIIIRDYLKNNVIENGYVSHTTNSLYAEDIKINGFTKRETDENTKGVLEELKEIFPEGFFKTDLNYIEEQKDRKGWFYDRSPYHFKRYSNGPEWFKRLTNDAYSKRDYQKAKTFIEMIMDYYCKPKEKKQQALEFFEKYWNMFAPTTPHMLLISTKNHELRQEREIELVNNLTLDEQIEYYTDWYFTGTDQNTEEEILPSEIIDIDMNNLVKINNYSK